MYENIFIKYYVPAKVIINLLLDELHSTIFKICLNLLNLEQLIRLFDLHLVIYSREHNIRNHVFAHD